MNHALAKTPAAFRQSIDQRLRNAGGNIERGRQLIAYERFLARLFDAGRGDVRIVLKGGLALEIRMVGARSTRDVDVTMFSAPDDLLSFLRDRVAVGDGSVPPDSWFSFEATRDPRRPEIAVEQRYGGRRFQVRCMLGGRPYARPFGLDVAFAAPVLYQPDMVPWRSSIAEAAIPGLSIPVLDAATHVAEKLHAYTRDYGRPNSRARDLTDLVLLSTIAAYEAAKLREAIDKVFSWRGTHAVPVRLPEPPAQWRRDVARFAEEVQVVPSDLEAQHAKAAAFLEPILGTRPSTGSWAPGTTSWTGM